MMTSYPVGNKTSLSHKPSIADKKLLRNAIRKSWSLFQNLSCKIGCLMWFAIKPRYLRNHTSQIKSYYGTLLGSDGHSFRIRHENVRAAPPGRRLRTTSVGNKTSLSQKPSIADKKLLRNAIRKSWLLFQNLSCKIG